MNYTALAIDLDGTLLIGDDLPDANRDAVRRAVKAGFQVIVATARWRQMAVAIAGEVGATGPLVACSGAEVFVPEEARDVFDYRLPEDFVAELFDLCDRERCVATVTFDERVLIKMDGEPDPGVLRAEMEWVPVLQGSEPSRPRIAAIQGSRVNALIAQELVPKYRDSVMVADSIGPNGKIIATITNAEANKGSALRAACAHAGINPEDVIAFGDAENDVPMFELCGASVAMGQADAETKSHATHVTLPNTECGVASAITTLLDTGHL